jgi:hypothetical protein
LVGAAATASSAELTPAELAQLGAGQIVVRPDSFARGGQQYTGGVSYAVIDATPEQVLAALEDVRAYGVILPRIRSVRWIGLSRRGDALVEVEQGNSIAHGKYTVRIARERPGEPRGGVVRFSLDHGFAADIADASGFFRAEPYGEAKTLLSLVVLFDLGPGLFRRLFEERIRAAALSTPRLVREYVEARRAK